MKKKNINPKMKKKKKNKIKREKLILMKIQKVMA